MSDCAGTSLRSSSVRTQLEEEGCGLSDDSMIGPGAHENTALDTAADGDVAKAQVYALLAVASAINRLANAVENRG